MLPNALVNAVVNMLVKSKTNSCLELEVEIEILELLEVDDDAGVLCLILGLLDIRLEKLSDKT